MMEPRFYQTIYGIFGIIKSQFDYLTFFVLLKILWNVGDSKNCRTGWFG